MSETNIVEKGKVAQFFCRHKESDWFKERSLFQNLSGETHHKVCLNCGKVIGERFLRYEGNGFK